jgi:hypothetical protein
MKNYQVLRKDFANAVHFVIRNPLKRREGPTLGSEGKRKCPK